MQFSSAQRAALLDLARATIRRALCAAPVSAPADRTAEADVDAAALRQPAGCFVSLHERDTHRLRGCVGRTEATLPLFDAVRDAAEAVLRDPRFVAAPVTIAELTRLEIELTVLSVLVPAPRPLEFNPVTHGIHLKIDARSGCFLPQVARDTGWSREQLLERLCTEKLTLPAAAWRRPEARLHTFTVQIIGPDPLVPVT